MRLVTAVLILAGFSSLPALWAGAQTGPDASTEGVIAGPDVSVREVLGVPTFVLGDKPFVTPCFETYHPEERYFRQFAEAGVELYSFNANVAACDYGHSKPVWVGLDDWDYSGFEDRFDRVLRADPDAMVMPRINLGTPRWWLDAHPAEMEILDSGSPLYTDPNRNPTLPKGRPFPSIASVKWREDMRMALVRFLDYVAGSKYAGHIFGYILAGLDTEEWYPWSSGSNQLSGYSEHTEAAFRDWLRQKYFFEDRLQEAWGRADVTFDTARVPSREARFDGEQGTFRDPAQKMDVIDFYTFYNELIPETIDYFARAVRDKTDGRKAIGAFYGYMYEFRGDPEYGHNALAKFNESENLDFIFVTASYGERQSGTGADYARSPAYSVQLHGKLWYHDNDVVSFLAPRVHGLSGSNAAEGQWPADKAQMFEVLGYSETPEATKWMYRRSMGFALCHGAYESYFDLHGGYYDAPALMDEVARLNRVANLAKRFYRTSNAEVLVVADEVSCAYTTFRNDFLAANLLQPQPHLAKMGAPADHVLLADLDRVDPRRYKMVVFLNCYHMTPDQRANITEQFASNGRHLVWCYAPGLFDGNKTGPARMQSLTGMSMVRPAPSETAIPRIVPVESTHPLALSIAAHSGDITGPEFNSAEDGTTIRTERLYVDDPAAVTLGVWPGTEDAAFALKECDDWTSVYVITSNLEPHVYRELARAAGVHIFSEKNDTFYANTSYVTLHADGAGERTITFPWACDVFDMVSEEYVAVNSDSYTAYYEAGQTRILRWKTRL